MSVFGSILGLILLAGGSVSATSYYVSSSSGNDANPGTQAQPFQSLAKVNGLGLAAGDSVLLKRGDVWNEQLIPLTSGTSANPITYDAYGSGAAPLLAPIINLSGATWTHNSGNIYTTSLTTAIASPQINNLQVGNFWGRKRSPNPGCATAGVIAGPGDFCLVYPTLYVYSPNGTTPSSYYGGITAIVGQASGLAVISVVNKSWLVFQHIKVQNFDYMGVSVSGTSDNLVFANMESDGMVPYGTTPHGFYVNAPSSAAIQFLNDEGMCANKSGAEKKDAAMSFLQNALAMSDAIAAREIVQPEQFRAGISQIIDGVVLCMNASAWAKREKAAVGN